MSFLSSFFRSLFKKKPAPVVESPTLRAVAVTVFNTDGRPVSGARVWLDNFESDFTGVTNDDGYVLFPEVPASLVESHVEVSADGYLLYSAHVVLSPGNCTVRIADPFKEMQDYYLPEPLTLFRKTPISKIRGRISTEGRMWKNDAGFFRPCFVSALTALCKPEEQVLAYLDWAAETGFNGVRVFAGALTWANQTAESARERLPALIEACERRGLYIEVTALTDSASGYDVEEHVRKVADICRRYDNTLLEIANEYWHPTQHERVNDVNYLKRLADTYGHGLCVALGAGDNDEPQSNPNGLPVAQYITLHLDRGRDKWNQVRRVRELEMASDHYDVPVMNNEPIGADERDGRETGKQRINDPAFFFTMGALCRLFEVGAVHHSQHGLMTELPGPVQQACAEAFLHGFYLVKTDERMTYKNAGWNDSPIKSALWETHIIRAYSGLTSTESITVALGLKGDPQIVTQNGWSLGDVLAEYPGVRVYRLTR